MIESFAIHARALINFFNGVDGSKASTFTDDKYVPFAAGRVPQRLVAKLNQQIPHITERRFNDSKLKFNGDDIKELRELLDPEVREFVNHLQPRYKRHWDVHHSTF
jgi:hypothetical protein